MKGLGKRFISFTAIGAVGTAVHYAFLVALVEAVDAPAAAAAGLGALAGAAVNYVLNYRLTFRSSVRHLIAAPRFAIVALAGVALSAVTVWAAVQLDIHYLLGQVFATLLVLVCGFLVNQFWTFPEAADGERHSQ